MSYASSFLQNLNYTINIFNNCGILYNIIFKEDEII